MGDFLDRVQSHSSLGDRNLTLEAVRAVFCGLMYGNGESHCREVAELLPGELETIWKPSLFTCLREHRTGNGTPRESDFTAVVQRRMPDLEAGDVAEVTRAVLLGLEPYLSPEDRRGLERRLPERLRSVWES